MVKDIITLYIELNLVTLIMIAGTLLFLNRDLGKYKNIVVYIRWNLLFSLILSVVDTLELWTASLTEPTIWRILYSAIGYSLRPIIILTLIWGLTKGKRKRALYSIPALLNALVVFSALFSDAAFSYNAQNEFERGPLGFVPHIVCGFYLIVLTVITLKHFDKHNAEERNLLLYTVLSAVIVIAFGTILDLPGKFNTIIATSNMFYYMYYYTKCTVENTVIDTMEKEQRTTLEHMAYVDALTELGNRAAFIEELDICEKNPNVACVVLDVNNLKLCNDRYGHHEGDKIISDAAECIQNAFGGLGKCFRIGGDEFSVLIQNKEKTEILEAIDQMNRLIEEKNHHRIMPLSIACGYAIRENMKESMEHLFNRGDEMMYDVKFRMKKEFPVYCEERIRNYLNVLEILSKSTDAYLFLWDIARDENWFLGPVDENYALRDKGKPTNTTAEMEAITYPADRQMLHDDLQEIINGTKSVHDLMYRWINRQGEVVWISCRGRVITDDKGKPFVMIGRVSDVALRYLYNPLTKLFNKTKMLKDLKEEFLLKNAGYLMLIDIDNLGNLNLKQGRRYGDSIIKEFAKILEQIARSQKVYHVENNCFALCLDAETENDARSVYEKLQAEMAEKCTLSAGVVPNNNSMFQDENNLYDCAEQTLNKAKENGKNTIYFFTKEDLEQRIQEIEFLGELQEGMKNNYEGFYLCYQPQVKAGNYHLYAAEALIRFKSKTRGKVSPDEFISMLEQSHLINQVGMWTLETALRQCKHWREHIPELRISVNFSTIQLIEKNIAEKVLDVLEKVGLPGNALTIEITESIQLQEVQYISDILNRWRGVGIEISIDDFGTGYSSLSYLKQLHVDEIKIDKMFVEGIEEATYNYRLVNNMIEFAKNNSIRICCEGVEDMRELAVLEGLSPSIIQGYLFDHPCEKEEFERSYINNETDEYKKRMEFVQKLYEYKEKMRVFYFDAKDILRKTNLGLWIIRINEEEQYFEMHADDTMERVMSVDRKYTPQECYHYWHDRIKEGYLDYVNKNFQHMIESDKVVQLQYPWNHPTQGEVIVRCTGRRVEDTDGMITLEGYHRILSNIEET